MKLEYHMRHIYHDIERNYQDRNHKNIDINYQDWERNHPCVEENQTENEIFKDREGIPCLSIGGENHHEKEHKDRQMTEGAIWQLSIRMEWNSILA